MPIRVPNNIPAKQQLQQELIRFIETERADTQDIRPLKVLILNLMPNKEVTETQLLRLLGNSPLQIEVTFLTVSTYQAKHTSTAHLEQFYVQFEEIKDHYYDALIITGAPVEHMAFEAVDYWEELQTLFDWSKAHVYSALHICWGAQARLYHDYHIPKIAQPHKIFGIYQHRTLSAHHPLTCGFDDVFNAPHSRHTQIDEAYLDSTTDLVRLDHSDAVGSLMFATPDLRQLFILGHIEYDRDSLKQEYNRDLERGLPITVPHDYFPDDDASKTPCHTWKMTATLFYHNWLNMVYQMTPYDLTNLSAEKGD